MLSGTVMLRVRTVSPATCRLSSNMNSLTKNIVHPV